MPQARLITIPKQIPSIIGIALDQTNRYFVVFNASVLIAYPAIILKTPPMMLPTMPRIAASYMNMLITSLFWVPILRMIPISLMRSVTDIIMILKIETPATIMEIPPIADTNVVTAPNAEKIDASVALLSITLTTLSLSLIHISEPTRRTPISYAVFCLKKKN